MDAKETLTREQVLRLGVKQVAGFLVGLADALQGRIARVEEVARREITPAVPPEGLLVDPATVGWVRPPGALEEADFLAACTSCTDCIEACPELVIRKAGPEMGTRLVGTPILLPAENPCVFCEGLPCVVACEAGALCREPSASATGVTEPGKNRIGLARIDAQACYQAQGQPCDYCVKACPERPRPIAVTRPGVAPVVRVPDCTGCGKCAEICPTNAIDILDHRPDRRPPS